MKFRKKPVVIEAFEYDGDLMNSKGKYYVPDWAVSAFKAGTLAYLTEWDLYVVRPEGNLLISVGDYVIHGVDGEIYPCKPDIFKATYEPVPCGE